MGRGHHGGNLPARPRPDRPVPGWPHGPARRVPEIRGPGSDRYRITTAQPCPPTSSPTAASLRRTRRPRAPPFPGRRERPPARRGRSQPPPHRPARRGQGLRHRRRVVPGAPRDRPPGGRRRVHGRRGQVRVWQVDPDEHDDRDRPGHRRRRLGRRHAPQPPLRGPDGRLARPDRRRDLPVLPAPADAHGGRERDAADGLRRLLDPEGARGAGDGAPRAGRDGRPGRASSRRRPPAASSSGSRSPGPSPTTRRSWSPTSRPATWTPRPPRP